MKNILVALLFVFALMASIPVSAMALDANRDAIWSIEKAEQYGIANQGPVVSPEYDLGYRGFDGNFVRNPALQSNAATSWAGLYIPRG
jgi:hypothetical protein